MPEGELRLLLAQHPVVRLATGEERTAEALLALLARNPLPAGFSRREAAHLENCSRPPARDSMPGFDCGLPASFFPNGYEPFPS